MSAPACCNRCGRVLPSTYIGHRAGRVDLAGPRVTERWQELHNQRLCTECWAQIELPAFGAMAAPTPLSLRAYAAGRCKETSNG